MRTVLLCLTSTFAFGVFMGFPALIPLFKRLAQEKETFRRRLRVGLVSLTFLAVYIVSAFVVGSSYTQGYNCAFSQETGQVECNYDPVPGGELEAWARTLLPPFLRGACLTGNTAICDELASADSFDGANQWGDYLLMWIGSSLAAATCALFVYYQTQPEPPSSSKRWRK